MASCIISTSGLLEMLNEQHLMLKLHVSTNIKILGDNFWLEISTNVSIIEILYEDEGFGQ